MDRDIEQDLQQLQRVYDLIVSFLVNYSFQLLGAMVVLIIGMLIAGRVSRMVLALCQRKNLDITLSRFFANVVKISLIVMIAIICLNMIGISITPLVAAIGAASLGVGLAVQGLLSNYGAGLNIILTRPFVVGDTITVQGVSGLVRDIHLAYTQLVNEDGVEITIPNKHIVGEILHNSHTLTLVELDIGVAYGSDLDTTLAILENALADQPAVDTRIKPLIGILEFGDSSVNLQVRFWARTDEVMAARFAINKRVWDVLKQHNVEIPVPQREIKILDKP